jgi:general secretion pathway protein G
MRTPARLTPDYAERRKRIKDRRRRQSEADRPAQDASLPGLLLLRKPAMFGALAAVLVIVGAVLVLSTKGTRPLMEDARLRKAENEVAVLNTALDLFQSDCGRYPSESERLVALVQNPGVSNWGGPYVNLVKPDPWQTRYGYSTDGTNAMAWSAGPDRISGTADDIRPRR